MTYLVQKVVVLLYTYLSYDLAVAHQVHFNTSNFEEQLWISLPLKGHDTLLIGCIYRSPTDNTLSNTIHYVIYLILSAIILIF